ncbi:hypothetical protein C8R43DRAFT_1242574 [Mycena crocata]|nr:hypothetical protein C8R43DRAFT_1242574 [Mycena crocata]
MSYYSGNSRPLPPNSAYSGGYPAESPRTIRRRLSPTCARRWRRPGLCTSLSSPGRISRSTRNAPGVSTSSNPKIPIPQVEASNRKIFGNSQAEVYWWLTLDNPYRVVPLQLALTTMSSTDEQNIAIIGGGPGGLRVSMAAVLHKAGFSQAMFTVYERDTDTPLGSCLDLHAESGLVSLQCKLRDGETVPRCRVEA